MNGKADPGEFLNCHVSPAAVASSVIHELLNPNIGGPRYVHDVFPATEVLQIPVEPLLQVARVLCVAASCSTGEVSCASQIVLPSFMFGNPAHSHAPAVCP